MEECGRRQEEEIAGSTRTPDGSLLVSGADKERAWVGCGGASVGRNGATRPERLHFMKWLRCYFDLYVPFESSREHGGALSRRLV